MNRINRPRARRAWRAAWNLVLLVAILAACGPAATDVVQVTSSAGVPAPTLAPSVAQATAVPTSVPSLPPTASATPRPSATATSTRTATPSATATRRPTLTPTLTLSRTPAVAATPLSTATMTGTVEPTPVPMVAFNDDTVNILLIGLDSTANLRGQNSDVIIVVSIDKDKKEVSMLSIPRDLWVYIPTYGWSRVNTAHRRGYSMGYPGEGPGLLARTLELNLGIPTDHWARVDFQGFTRVVDELGGVTMTVACPVNLRYKKPESEDEEEMILQAGVYDMDGELALRYVRTRRDGSDFDRARRQQQFLKAMWAQFKNPGLILKIPGLYAALKNSIKTDLSLGDLISLAGVGIDIQPQRVHSYYIGANETQDWITPEGWQVLVQRPDKVQAVVSRLASPPVASEDRVSSEGAVVHVLNGTTRADLARFAADQLQWYGVKIELTGQADRTDYKETQIIVHGDNPETVEQLARVLKVKPANIISRPDPGQAADIQVILGADYDPCK